MTPPEAGEVQFGRRTLHYTVQRSGRRRTVGIVVSALGVTVKAPPDITRERLAQIVHGRGTWVVSKQVRFAALQEAAPLPRVLKNGAAVRYVGRQCRVWTIPGLQDVRRNGRRIEVPPLDEGALRQLLEQWYREQAQRILEQRVGLYARRLGVYPAAVLIRDQRARWGSCSASGALRFNWRIVMAPMALIDYVVAHELCHLEHMHHGPAFWNRLSEVMPDHEQRRERLAQEGVKYIM